MRELKFRVYDKDKVGEWDYFDLTEMDDTYMRTINLKCPIMQYTGQKDKNGKEIYEGDIVEPIPNGGRWKMNPYVVKNCNGEYNLPKLDISVWGMDEPPTRTDYEYKVIGNIYENPELIEGGK